MASPTTKAPPQAHHTKPHQTAPNHTIPTLDLAPPTPKGPPTALLRQMVEQNLSTSDIAKELGVSTPLVYQWLTQHLPDLQSQLRQERDANIIVDYDDPNIPVHKILTNHGVSVTTLYAILRRNQITLRRDRTNPADKIIIQLYTQGETVYNILAKTGKSVNYIYKTLRAHGVQLRRPTV